MKTIQLKKDICIIEDFWSAQKCANFISKSEKIGYEAATIQTETGPRLVESVRKQQGYL